MQKIVKLPKTAKQIKNSKDFADIDGKIYTVISNYKGQKTNKFVEKTQHTVYGYKYCGIYDQKHKKSVQKRVHRIIAETFIPNPNNYPIVGHKNNIKSDNRIENLYWTTYQENIQKAVNDKLLVNDKGYDDSQSKPVIMFDTYTNKILGKYGSIKQAVKITGLSETTIRRQAKYQRPTRKPYYFRYQNDPTATAPQIIGMFNYDTDTLLQTFIDSGDASRKTNKNSKTILQQCQLGKPKHKFSNVYFKFLTSKCEQTIEHPKGK